YWNGPGYSRDHQLYITFRQLAVERHRSCGHDIEHNAWIATGEPIDYRKSRPGRRALGATDPQLSRRRVGQEFDVPHALSDFMQDRAARLDARAAVVRRFDAAPAAVEKPNAERVFQICDRSRYSGLRNSEPFRCLVHTARVHHRKQNPHVMDLETALDAF